jgi:serine/threonine protein kinase
MGARLVAEGTQLSQYRIVRRIGAGGMAEVFLAQVSGAAGFTRPVAIKTILAAGAPQESITLFLDEARVASILHHASIVQTLDLGYENETLFIVMEYVPGPPLSRVIHELKVRGRTLPPHVTAYVGAKIAAALDFAHRRVMTASGQPLNLVHRDVSPQNILVTRAGMVKLTDFGVARASIQTHRTKTGQVRGKAAYMAPEQVRAQPLDGRTDMFALGLVLYEALTTTRAFQRKSEIASMRAIINEDVPPIHDRNPDVPKDLAEVITRTLRRPKEERYANCGELEEALMRTIRQLRHSAIEDELSSLLVELFGDEQFTDSMPAVEGWQPTLISGSTPVLPRTKLPSGSLSPELAQLLGQTPPTPITPASSTGGSPLRAPLDPPPGAVTQPPLRPPPGADLKSDAARLRVTVPSRELPHQLPGTIPLPTPPAIPGLTPSGSSAPATSSMASPISVPSLTQIPSITHPLATQPMLSGPPDRGRAKTIAWITGGGAALALAAIVASRLATPPEPIEAPVGAEPKASTPRAVVAQPPPKIAQELPPPRREPEPAPEARPIEERRPPKQREPRETRAKEPKEREAARPPPPPPSARRQVDKSTLVARVLSLKKRATAQPELQKKLGDLANDLLIGREASPEDLELVERAEQMLE